MAPPKSEKRELARARLSRDAALKSVFNLHVLSQEASSDTQKQDVFLARYISLERFRNNVEKEQQIIMSSLVGLERGEEYFEVDEAVSDKLEQLCGEIEASYRILNKCIPTTQLNSERANCASINRTLTLPKIELPKFDGSAVQWCTFRDMFLSAVHTNNDLKDVERFHYLIAGLSGPPLMIVKSVPLTAENYDIAWRALNNQYDNKRHLITAHLDKLFTFERIQRESVPALMSFISTFRENVAAIKALGVDDLSGFLLFYIGARALDTDTRRLFEEYISIDEIPKLDKLLEFAAHRCKILENSGTLGTKQVISSSVPKRSKGDRSSGKTSLAATTTTKTVKCLVCERDHAIYRCFIFKKKSVTERREFVVKKRLCFICLSADHMASACRSTYLCKSCNGRHHILLHINVKHVTNMTDTESAKFDEKSGAVVDKNEGRSSSPSFSGTSHSDISVVLATALVRIKDSSGTYISVRILLDSGSQISAITTECANRLGLPRFKTRTEVVGLAQQRVKSIRGSTSCDFIPSTVNVPTFTATNVAILNNIITSMPNEKLPKSVRERYGHLQLADPEFDTPGPIDMLIGGDLYPLVLGTRSDIVHSPGLPSALHTQLGWVIVGALRESVTSAVSLVVNTTPAIDAIMQQFWAVEEPHGSIISTTENEMCERWFKRTVSRDTAGRFKVALPFKKTVMLHSKEELIPNEISRDASSVGLGSSRSLALNRLYNLERRLSKDPELYEAYRKFMDEYITLGHMKLATREGIYFIPHHAVVKHQENDLKIRVVFDASAVSSSGLSLNDCLVTGPKLQTDISDILLHCRFHKYIFIADIVKMYRQILIRDEDLPYQHILWRSSPNEQVKEYELCTITYGMNAAPYLAIRCLHQLDLENGPEFPLATNLLRTSTYVDDIIAGADSVENVVLLQQQVIQLLQKGCFELKKWASNCSTILQHIPKEDLAMDSSFEPNDGQAVKVLGLYWNANEDSFGYRSSITETQLTKRSILSTVARLYDPIGALSPTIFWAKCIMQEIWEQKLDWDTPISDEIAQKWNVYMSKLSSLDQLKIPRFINIQRAVDVQLVGFSDASQKGYAASVYLRVVDSEERIHVYFVACKTKVAPLKATKTDISLTIPRLELCAAVLLARVLSHRLTLLSNLLNIRCVRAFSDSTIVLSWLKSQPKDFKVFVTNRVSKIKELLPHCEWNHVSSKENAADPASRGLFPNELLTCDLHWKGPDFLRRPEAEWPNSIPLEIPIEQLPEFKKNPDCVLLLTNNNEPERILQRFSSLGKMQRVLAYCLRFIDVSKRRPIETGVLSRVETDRALRIAIKITQNIYWAQLQRQLTSSLANITPTNLAQLSPFLDVHGIIRVGGRLHLSLLSEDSKHPILLPKKSHLTELVILHNHLNLLHAGLRLTMSIIFRRFWIMSGRAAIRQVIHGCIRCVRHRAACPQPQMSTLPAWRVQPHRPFSFVGMDYGGPFIVKESRRRNSRTNKAYLALFVCLSVKAIHLEIVSDISTEAFLAAFDRFTARRGIPCEIHSDCGTNYVGAARQLKALFKEQATQEILNSRTECQWKFNPPAAPHFGGIWEAAIKSSKTHLKKVIGAQVLTMEELTTLVIRIEGILNSRPISTLSSDPNDVSALTPGHFLIGQPLAAIPNRNVVDIPMNRLNRWQLIQQAQQSFWKRWSHEYLHTLQGRQKWFHDNPTLKIGDLVAINSPLRPLMAWQLGRVIAVHPGIDNVVRVVTLKTAEGILKRPVVKLVKLPVS